MGHLTARGASNWRKYRRSWLSFLLSGSHEGKLRAEGRTAERRYYTRSEVKTGWHKWREERWGENLTGLRSRVSDEHHGSRRAGEKRGNTKSSVLQQQVGFVRRNKRTKMFWGAVGGKINLSCPVWESPLFNWKWRKRVFQGGKLEEKHQLQCEYKEKRKGWWKRGFYVWW